MSWVPKAISRAGGSGASAKSGPSPIYLSVSRSLCPARRSAPTAGRDRTNLASLTTYPASTRVPFLALRARAEGAGLRGTDACGGWAEVAPLELAGETSARQPRREWGAWPRDAVTVAPCALPRAGGDAAGGAAGDGAYRNVLPHPGARSRRAAPSRVPGPGPKQQPRGSGSRDGDRSGCRGGLQLRCAHISPRAPVPQGAAIGVFIRLSRPGRAVVEGSEAPSSGHEAEGHRGVTGPLVTGRVTRWLRGRERRSRHPLPPHTHPSNPSSHTHTDQPQSASLTKPKISSTFGHLAKSRCQHLPGFAGLLELPTGFSRIPCC